MLTWYREYYIGDGVKNVDIIRDKLEHRKPVPGIYLLTYPTNPSNLLDIIPAITLVQRAPRELCPEIIGIAKGKDEAIELLQEIVMTVYRETGGFEIEEYLRNR